MQDGLALLIGEVHIHHAHIAAQRGVGDGALRLVRVPPGPVPGVLLDLAQFALFVGLDVHERDIAIVLLRGLVDQAEDALGAGAGHDDGVDLLRELVDVAGELPRHIEEGHEDRHVQRETGKRDVRHLHEDEHTAHEGESHIEDIAYIGNDGA